jgi:ribosomal protein S18 acetylase RimI-like enzyme
MTLGFTEARTAYLSKYPTSPFFDTWLPKEKFVGAEVDELGNFTISREDEGIYGIALGPSPVIPDDWKNFSIESQGIASLPDEFKVVAEWDCYWSPTVKGELESSAASADPVIDAFLKQHAPDSSVYPGNDEILTWVEVHDEGELVAVAALCRWESGRVVISSVATHADRRGKGFGKQLIEKCLIAGSQLGEEYLCLGVRHRNESAQRLYASTGFTLMHNFTYCERR